MLVCRSAGVAPEVNLREYHAYCTKLSFSDFVLSHVFVVEGKHTTTTDVFHSMRPHFHNKVQTIFYIHCRCNRGVAGSRIHLCKLSSMGAWAVPHCLPNHWTNYCTDPRVQTRQDWTLAIRPDASSFGN